MQQQPYQNKWQEFHGSLEPGIAKNYKEKIQQVLNISQSAFYRKLKQPERYLSIAEKQAIARVYHIKETYLFPELQTVP